MNLAKELSALGHEVKVVYPELTDHTYEGFESRIIKFQDGTQANTDLPFNFPCFTSHPRSNNTYYALTNDQMQAYIDIFVKIAKEEAETFKPDLIHAQHLWITPYAAAQTGIPYIVTAHGTDLKGFVKDERYHPYAIEGAKKAKKIITISKQVHAEVKDLYGVPEEKCALIMNGYDENLFMIKPDINTKEVLSSFNIEGTAKHIVSFAGKLTHFKGIDVLLKAAKQYEREIGDVMTLIAGNGELYDELTRLSRELGLEKVHFLGHVNQKQLVDLYNIADVSTVPSRTEPFGLVAIEALACGTPVVGTNQGGLPDFVTDKVGTLVPVEDDLSLAEAIIDEIERADRQERAQACAKYALESFSWKHSIKEVEALYKTLI